MGAMSAEYRNSGVVVATDGSLKSDGAMGAAFVALGDRLPSCSAAVFGRPMSIRPEMTAILMAVEACPTHEDLTILTDSLSSIRLLQNLQRVDFRPWLHSHPVRSIAE